MMANSGEDCLSYKIRETMLPKKFKPTPTDAAKYDVQQEPRSWIDDYLHTVIHKGNQIAAMRCLQLYLKDSARAWLRGLPKGSIKSWDDLVDAFVANFQATYKRPVGIEELRNCQQKQRESMKEKIEFEVVNWESQYHAILGRPAYAKFMAVPHYAYLKLKMHGNNGTNITVYGSFSRSDNCDRDFQRIAAKFGSKQEIIKPPPKLSIREIKEEKHDRESKKKPADLALKASAPEASAPEASAAKGSAVDGIEGIENSKTLATTVRSLGEINNAAAATTVVKKAEDEKNPFLA
ncbi:hypothetical protein QYE76_017084 [Lolium multiflorum]|uniref:Retrotransposon gag domain-containing protein n=1 Tax=Lolium multiflorum TaxID=4521 RepID=A0AAD8QFA4_LOLMU|nr:hypothetical protein QYE76_017084 [Lolium multiflorum]